MSTAAEYVKPMVVVAVLPVAVTAVGGRIPVKRERMKRERSAVLEGSIMKITLP